MVDAEHSKCFAERRGGSSPSKGTIILLDIDTESVYTDERNKGNTMKNLSVEFATPNVFIKMNEKTMFVPSMILSVISASLVANFLPQLMPVYMAYATRSWI